MTNFTIKFRGVRGSYPVAKKDFLKYGGNTSCIEVKCGKQLVVLDSGTGIIEVGNDIVNNNFATKQTTIILSHIHQDHIQGLQFYKPLFSEYSKVNLFGLNKKNEDLKTTLNNILFDTVFPLNLYEIKSDFKIDNFSSNEIILIYQDGKVEKFETLNKSIKINENVIKITSYKTIHPKDGCLCIKLEYNNKILIYATDRESVDGDENFFKFAKNCNCLIHDAQYTSEDYNSSVFAKKGFGHSTFDMAKKVSEKIFAKKLYFYHYDPDYNDKKLELLEKIYTKNNIFFAKENDIIEL